jgi:hypothetical protein
MQVQLYPTLRGQTLMLSVQLSNPQPLELAIYDPLGNCCRQFSVPSEKSHSLKLSVAGLAAGTYYLQIDGGKNRVVKAISIVG